MSKHVIESYDDPFIGYTAPMVDLGAYLLKDLNKGNSLLTLTSENCMSYNTYVLILNDCA